MKVEIPEAIKADMPANKWGKTLSTTPVIMAVIATLLAGLASSEMTHAQYDRSLGAQLQSKAGDQWGYFQAKRLRGSVQRSSADVLQAIAEIHAFNGSALASRLGQMPGEDPQRAELSQVLASAPGISAVAALERGEAPVPPPADARDASLQAAIEAIESQAAEADTAKAIQETTDTIIDQTMQAAKGRAREFDRSVKPISQAIDRIDHLLAKLSAAPAEPTSADSSLPALRRDFTAARLGYTALRYEVEARLNQDIADLYEVQVRRSNMAAERHHRRSQRFFFGMLGAQLGVIISTVALAAKQRNILWSIAAGAGLAAVAFAGYVFVFV